MARAKPPSTRPVRGAHHEFGCFRALKAGTHKRSVTTIMTERIPAIRRLIANQISSVSQTIITRTGTASTSAAIQPTIPSRRVPRSTRTSTDSNAAMTGHCKFIAASGVAKLIATAPMRGTSTAPRASSMDESHRCVTVVRAVTMTKAAHASASMYHPSL